MENTSERIRKMKSINVETVVRKGENIERAIKRFTKKVKKETIIEDTRERQYYEKPSEIKRRLKKRRKATLDKLKAKQETN
jgi:small subunit ribosomal protein S21